LNPRHADYDSALLWLYSARNGGWGAQKGTQPRNVARRTRRARFGEPRPPCMCHCKREVDEGRLAGPSDRELAAKWARLVMIGPDNFAERLATDEDIASGLRALG
jgi:hypothetical protein